MVDGDDHDRRRFFLVNDHVREVDELSFPIRVFEAGETLRLRADLVDASLDRVRESIAQPRLLPVVPIDGRIEFGGRDRVDAEPLH